MINCMIIDDEPLAVQVIEAYIAKVPYLRLAATCHEPLLALEHLNREAIDLLFLDIRMPDINGIDFFKALPRKPTVIFTTAHSQYALDGFEIKAADYLLKPVAFERFMVAVNYVKDSFAPKEPKVASSKDYFFINVAHKIHKVNYDDILYLEGYKDYTKIYLESQAHPLLVLYNLKHFEETLPGSDFIRIHRSYIISISKLTTLTRKSVSIGPVVMPVSDNFRERLFALME